MFLLIFLLFLLSCAQTPSHPRALSTHVIEGVPFYPQEQYQCGPASLAGILNYLGVRVLPEDIAKEIYSESARGTLDQDMARYAEKTGLKASQYSGNLQDLKERIDRGIPLILLVDDGIWVYERSHFMVAIGYDEKRIIVNSGRDRLKGIAFGEFLRSWRRTGFWTLVITR